MQTLIAVLRASKLVKIALLGLLLGAGLAAYGQSARVPPRASLQSIEATVAGATQITRTRRRSGTTSTEYELRLKPAQAGAAEVRLTIPAGDIGEPQIRLLLGRPVRAEFDRENDVYVLSQGGREVLGYERSVARRKVEYRQFVVGGTWLLGGSAVLLLVAGLLTWRRLTRTAAAPAS